MPDDVDLDKRLMTLEQSLRAAAASQKLGNLLSFGLLGFAIFQWWTRPPPVEVYVVDDGYPPIDT